MSKQSVMVNWTAASEAFTLPADVDKVEWTLDKRSPNSGTFLIRLEDHTLGNLLKISNLLRYCGIFRQLLMNPDVVFIGYRVPHPLENNLEMRIQTKKSTEPAETMRTALAELHKRLTSIKISYSESVARKLRHNETAAAVAGVRQLGSHNEL